LFTVQKGLPLLNDGGFIIRTGSVAGVKGTPSFGVYAATKAAIRAFVRSWTTDLKGRHIRSNVVSPGPIPTPQEGRDPEVNDKVSPAEVEAMGKWGVQQKGSYDYLKTIKQPTLVVNGSNDVIMPMVNPFIMQQNMPNAQLIVHPDSNHAAHHMYPELFVEQATLFLNA
jgi:NAD(P)-dependent dehydrogenase (short-subunit alcohol dehydrogenase family)